MKALRLSLTIITGVIATLMLLTFFTTFHPPKIKKEKVISPKDAPILNKDQKIKVLSWNVQYMASKNYVFYYDLLDNSGPDAKPSKKDVANTLKEVARVIINENPDVILLQEINYKAKNTGYDDQLKRLLKLIPKEYTSYTSTFYWKALFVPHPKIMGSVGMKLVTISKYKITSAKRYQLPITPKDIFSNQFYFKRAVLEARLPISDSSELIVANTHLDAFSQGTNTMTKQVKVVDSLLKGYTEENKPWLIAGDFNLLASKKAYNLLADKHKAYYNPETELKILTDKYSSVPSYEEINSSEYKKCFTHFPNDPSVKEPDRTIDYYFLSKKINLSTHYVRQYDTLAISDHLPVVIEFNIKK